MIADRVFGDGELVCDRSGEGPPGQQPQHIVLASSEGVRFGTGRYGGRARWRGGELRLREHALDSIGCPCGLRLVGRAVEQAQQRRPLGLGRGDKERGYLNLVLPARSCVDSDPDDQRDAPFSGGPDGGTILPADRGQTVLGEATEDLVA